MTKESITTIKVLRSCFAKLSNAIGYVNNTFEQFWLMDTLQMMVTTVSYLSRMVLNVDKFSKKSYSQILISAMTIMRLLLLATCCGDASDEVNVVNYKYINQ
jgi:hypothetical protein